MITSIPSEFGHLIDLKVLSLYNNKIISIDEISIINLRELYLGYNSITTISKINNLVNLQILDLHNNSIITIPPEIGQLVNLRKLYLDHNLIESILSEISQLHESPRDIYSVCQRCMTILCGTDLDESLRDI